MPVSLHAFGPPDTSGAIFLPNLASALLAHGTLHSSSTEPPVKAACMPWFDLSTNTFKIRDASNIAWIPVWRLTNAGVEPLLHGLPLGPLATLVPGSAGYIWANADGTVMVQDVTTPDIPVFAVRTAGMVPGPTAAQSDFRSRLAADGTWRDGAQLFGSRAFAGAQDYAIGNLPRSDFYSVQIRAVLSNAQSLVLQIGSAGSPKQGGYVSSVSRVDAGGDDAPLTWGFDLWREYDSPIRTVVIRGELVAVGDNMWTWTGAGGWIGGGHGDFSRGQVQLSGPLDFMRVLPCGNPRGTFNARASMNDGILKVFG